MADTNSSELTPNSPIPDTEDTSIAKKYFKPLYIAIYLVLAVLVYGFIHFLFLAEGSSFKLGNIMTKQPTNEQVGADQNFLGELNGVADPSVNGIVVIYPEGQSTVVQLSLNMGHYVAESNLSAGVFEGNCGGRGKLVYKLSNLYEGISDSFINEDYLKFSERHPLSILVSETRGSEYTEVACGDIIF